MNASKIVKQEETREMKSAIAAGRTLREACIAPSSAQRHQQLQAQVGKSRERDEIFLKHFERLEASMYTRLQPQVVVSSHQSHYCLLTTAMNFRRSYHHPSTTPIVERELSLITSQRGECAATRSPPCCSTTRSICPDKNSLAAIPLQKQGHHLSKS